MTSLTQVLKSVGPKLVPFLKTVAIYFVLFIPVEKPSWLAMVIKCLPIISLIIFVLLHGISLGDEYAFSRRILFGLVFSCIGDAFLVWDEYFLHGMAAFGVAQIMYTSAFGFTPLNASLGALLYSLCGVSLVLLLPGLSGLLKVLVPVYSALLVTTVWRGIARVQFFKELWTWTKLCSCAGGIMWAISDALIGFHHFHQPIPYSQLRECSERMQRENAAGIAGKGEWRPLGQVFTPPPAIAELHSDPSPLPLSDKDLKLL